MPVNLEYVCDRCKLVTRDPLFCFRAPKIAKPVKMEDAKIIDRYHCNNCLQVIIDVMDGKLTCLPKKPSTE